MSNNKMLIDATHPEETRVVVLRGGRVEEFDYESAARKPLRGNIYLAKVTRVEPSLQAAFVEYGGNRHGFLAFNEIHPDYYQIPVADRQALLDEEAAAEAEEEAAADARAERMSRRRGGRRGGRNGERGHGRNGGRDAASGQDDDHEDNDGDAAGEGGAAAAGDRDAPQSLALDVGREETLISETIEARAGRGTGDGPADNAGEPADLPAPIGLVEVDGVEEVEEVETEGDPEAEDVEQVSTEEDVLEEVPSRQRRRPRSYKIQEVIKRRQVILVQVVKEERGNKGAALTTYLSLAGRYTVLMPNTARGGGISRKITNPADRKRLKAIAHDLEVPEGMGLIIRTAGAARTQQEIKRDFEYLLRLWESVRDMTLQSTAPSVVYEEGDLIKRSIRDHFTKDVDEVIVAGEHAYAEARDFMRMLMPSHAKNVIDYKEPEPLFNRFQIERQLNAMFSPFVTLKSGGYLVINQTEALVAIDINSGKSTREFSIEETALNTNLEAADEIARQLKLRDLAGLIVIDFIDMEEKRNNRSVERRIKDALRFDRARIQVGRISHFGLLEMSRQRLRTGVLEGSTSQCPHCQGTGIVRSTESVALAVLRSMEDALINSKSGGVVATTTTAVALYILNNKRAFIVDMERRYQVPILVQSSDKLHGANFTIERTTAPALPTRRPERAAVSMDWGFEDGDGVEEVDEAPERGESTLELVDDGEDGDTEFARGESRRSEERGSERSENGHGDNGQDGGRRRRRRRRRGGRRDDQAETSTAGSAAAQDHDHDADRGQGRDQGPDDDHDEDRGGDSEIETIGGSDEEPSDREGEDRSEARGEAGDGSGGRRGRRRGRRGGRRGRERNGDGDSARASGHEDQRPVDPGTAPQPDVDFPFPPASYTTNDEQGERPQRRDGGRGRGRDRHRGERGGNGSTQHGADRHGTGAAALIAAQIAASFAEASTPPASAAPSVETMPAQASHHGEPTPAAPEPAPATRRRMVETAPVEPKLERVVVRPDQPAAAEAPSSDADAAAKPSRRGWWQRRLLGGE